MTYFSLLYETAPKEYRAKEKAKTQPYQFVSSEKERIFKLIGSKMVEINEDLDKEKYKIPAYFKDLNLDQVIDKIVLEDNDSLLTETFYELLQDRDEILYRQDIFKDLEHEKVYHSILELQSCISQVYRIREYAVKANHSIQYQKYMLDAMNLYYDGITGFIEETAFIFKSAGLTRLHSLFTAYASSHTFLELREKSRILKEKIEAIRYHLTLLPDRILFHFGGNENDFSLKIKDTFLPDKKDTNEFIFFRQVTLTDLELKFTDLLYKKEKSLFNEASDFTAAYSDFINPVTARIHRELKFYTSCHTYITSLKSKHFSFCYPAILKERKIELNGVYDIAMASGSEKDSDIITNYFTLDESHTGAWVTGANQGGKTTFARSLGQVAYFMLLGMPVPGSYARLPLFNGIFTHFCAEENAGTDNGKLKEELLHIKDMLTYASGSNNLFILNELFSSTTASDAFDMSRLLVSKLAELNSTVICVTHVPSLAAYCKDMLSLGTEIGNHESNRRTYRIIPKPPELTAYAADIAGKCCLTYHQITEELNNVL
jgi:hypothetical protein